MRCRETGNNGPTPSGMIPIDKYQDDDTLVVRVELAGIDPEVDVECGQSAGFDRAAPTRDCAGRGRAGGRERCPVRWIRDQSRRPVVVTTIIPQVRGVTSLGMAEVDLA